MKSIKYWTKIVLSILIIVVLMIGIILLTKKTRKIIHSPFKEELKIESTANVVSEIRKIAELTTASFFEEIVIHDQKPSESIGGKVINEVTGVFKGKDAKATIQDNIVIIAHGTVRAGVDLSTLSDTDVVVKNDSCIVIQIPQSKILETDINPSDLDIYIEDGKWSHLQVTRVEQKARKQIEADALNDGILTKADKSAHKKITELIKALGYKEVIIQTKKC